MEYEMKKKRKKMKYGEEYNGIEGQCPQQKQ